MDGAYTSAPDDVNSTSSSNLYEVLGVDKDASNSDIRKQYFKLARKYHPDRNNGNAEAEAKFKEVAHAFQILSDAQSREAYDRFGEDGTKFSNISIDEMMTALLAQPPQQRVAAVCGLGFIAFLFTCLLLLVGLKAASVITWSWWWVAAPAVFPLGLSAAGSVLAIGTAIIKRSDLEDARSRLASAVAGLLISGFFLTAVGLLASKLDGSLDTTWWTASIPLLICLFFYWISAFGAVKRTETICERSLWVAFWIMLLSHAQSSHPAWVYVLVPLWILAIGESARVLQLLMMGSRHTKQEGSADATFVGEEGARFAKFFAALHGMWAVCFSTFVLLLSLHLATSVVIHPVVIVLPIILYPSALWAAVTAQLCCFVFVDLESHIDPGEDEGYGSFHDSNV